MVTVNPIHQADTNRNKFGRPDTEDSSPPIQIRLQIRCIDTVPKPPDTTRYNPDTRLDTVVCASIQNPIHLASSAQGFPKFNNWYI